MHKDTQTLRVFENILNVQDVSFRHLIWPILVQIIINFKGKTPPKECPGYDIKQSDGEVPILEI